MAAQVDIIVNAQDNFSGVLGNFGNIITGVKAGLDLLAGAFGAAYDFGSQFVAEASSAQDQLMNLEATLISTQGAAGLTSDELVAMADALSQVTRFEDDTIIRGEAMLLTFTNIGKDIMPQATEAMLNLAQKMGTDVAGAAIQLGKALNDPVDGVTALRRVGVALTDDMKAQIATLMDQANYYGQLADQAERLGYKTDAAAYAAKELKLTQEAQLIILGELQTEFGGLAEAMGATFGGQVIILQNNLGNLKEAFGNELLPVLTDVFQTLNKFATMPEVTQFFSDLGAAVSDLIEPFALLFEVFQMRIEAGANPLQALIDTLQGSNIAAIEPFVNGLLNLITTVQTFIQTGQSEGWGTAISDLFAGFDFTGKLQGLSDTLATALDGVDWSSVVDAIAGVINSALLLVLGGLDIIVNQIDWSPLGNAMKGMLSEIWKGMTSSDNVKSLGDTLLMMLNSAIDWVASQFGGSANDLFTTLFQLEALRQYFHDTFWEVFKAIPDALIYVLSGSAMRDAIWTLGNNIIHWFKQVLGIASRSKVFYEIALDIVQGLMDGLNAAWSGLLDLVTTIVASLLEPFAPLLQALGIDISGLVSGGGVTLPGGTGTGGTGGGAYASTMNITNNFFGPVTFSQWPGGDLGGGSYDCPTPNPVITTTVPPTSYPPSTPI